MDLLDAADLLSPRHDIHDASVPAASQYHQPSTAHVHNHRLVVSHERIVFPAGVREVLMRRLHSGLETDSRDFARKQQGVMEEQRRIFSVRELETGTFEGGP